MKLEAMTKQKKEVKSMKPTHQRLKTKTTNIKDMIGIKKENR